MFPCPLANIMMQWLLLQAAGPRVIAPRSGVTPRVDGNRSSRDERRRASHNEGKKHASS